MSAMTENAIICCVVMRTWERGWDVADNQAEEDVQKRRNVAQVPWQHS
ncbi:hypothetical protein HJB61_15530 [Rhizobium lentis]|nr:hypothetical protein [Rhizobium lentis]